MTRRVDDVEGIRFDGYCNALDAAALRVWEEKKKLGGRAAIEFHNFIAVFRTILEEAKK